MKKNRLSEQSFEEHESDELWAISYGDMITLLLSFFVIFFSTDFKKTKIDDLDKHLMSSFKMVNMNQAFKSPASSNEALQFDLLKNAKITKIDDRLVITFDTMTFFKVGEIEPNQEGQAMLRAFAEKFTPYAGIYHVSIKAFTDSRKVSTKHLNYKDNMELSALRALAALRVIQRAGIPLDRMEIAGYGEMNKLQSLMTKERLKAFSPEQIKDISRTVVLIIKHDNEQSVL
jgi:flagellar motor protein MotB